MEASGGGTTEQSPTDRLQKALEDLRKAADDATGEVRSQIDSAMDQIKEASSSATSRAQDQVSDLRGQLDSLREWVQNATVDLLEGAGYAVQAAPDAKRALALLGEHPEIELMIGEHHKLRAFRDDRYPLVEVFRKADLVDVSLGVVKFGITRKAVSDIQSAFPNAGFHKRLMGIAREWFSKHPLKPPPFYKW